MHSVNRSLRENQLQESGQQIVDAQEHFNAFMKYRSKPQPTTFSSKALNFHASEYRSSHNAPILVENDEIDQRNYNTQFDGRLMQPG